MTDPYAETTAVCAAPGCTRPADPVLCGQHVEKFGLYVSQLGAMFDRLDAAPSMQGKDPDAVGSSGGLKSHRNVGDHAVMSLRDARTAADPDDPLRSVLATLAGWADAVRAGRDLTSPTRQVVIRLRDKRNPGALCEAMARAFRGQATPCRHDSCRDGVILHTVWADLTVATERRLLSDHLGWLVQQPWAGDAFEEIRAVWGLLEAATEGRRPRRTAVCACGGRITVTAMVAECGGCGARWEGLELARLGAVA